MLLITQPRTGTYGKLHNEIMALHFAAKELGWEVYTPESSWRLPEELIASGVHGVPYGSSTFCEVIAQQMGWTLLQNQFDWLAKLPIEYTKRKVEFMTLAEAKQLTETKFIKPADDKLFLAKVYYPGELITNDTVPLDTPTLVSDVVRFDIEYRCFMEMNRVRTWSNYIFHENVADPKYWNVVDTNDEVLCYEFVQDMLWDLETVDTVPSVIDVGRIVGKGLAIIESNPCWASGIYGCDPMRVLKVIAGAVKYGKQ